VWLLAWGVLVGRDDAARGEHGRLGSSEKLTKAATTSHIDLHLRLGVGGALHFNSTYSCVYINLQLGTSRNANIYAAPPI
jgi:hypothetical protein